MRENFPWWGSFSIPTYTNTQKSNFYYKKLFSILINNYNTF